MKLFKLYILIVIICLFFGVGNAYNHKHEDVKITEESTVNEPIEEKKEESKSEIIEEPKQEKMAEKQEVKTTPKQNNTSSASKSDSKNNPTKIEPKTNNQTNNSSSESGVVDSNGNNIPEEHNVVIDKKPWEKAGVSEYDWYHKPVHSWMRIDYSVHTCGSVSNCEAQCMNDAEELSYTENVSCIQVYTYSGSYLGEMLQRQ